MAKDSIYKRYAAKPEPLNKLEQYTYWFVFYENKLLLNTSKQKAELPFIPGLEALSLSAVRTRHLGIFAGSPCYLAEVDDISRLSSEMGFYDLKTLYAMTDYDIFLLAGKAMQILEWDKTHQFCGRCGDKMNAMQDETAKVCPNCGLINYTRISPAVIVGIFKEDKILLAHSASFKANMYSILAGYIEPGETLEDGIKREVMEEVGITIKNIKYFGSQAWPFSSSLMIGFTAEYESGEISVDDIEIADAGWFDVNNLPELPSEYSIAREIINAYVDAHKSEETQS